MKSSDEGSKRQLTGELASLSSQTATIRIMADLCIKCGTATEFGAMFCGSAAVIAHTTGVIAGLDMKASTTMVLTRGAQKFGEQEFFAMADQDDRLEMWLPLCPRCVRPGIGPLPTVTDREPWNQYEFIPKGSH